MHYEYSDQTTRENSPWQLVAIWTCGAGIILGGLWSLYAAEGPYHPAYPPVLSDGLTYDGS